jgi:hypothetical protein|tara:strand:+ start:1059 stop:1238 length:180 start_codon:yes stop_codon:yes gene_type:complete
MEKLDKIVEIKSEEMKVEVDPRSKTSANRAFNAIAVPEEVEVRGTKRMLKEKSKKAKWI